ncbi:hypothetical protein NQZ68_014912 [Dissostichus eleginoides]|nr:hypothetical protein NQZ68_014912 [Dissostichus eleginoides]
MLVGESRWRHGTTDVAKLRLRGRDDETAGGLAGSSQALDLPRPWLADVILGLGTRLLSPDLLPPDGSASPINMSLLFLAAPAQHSLFTPTECRETAAGHSLCSVLTLCQLFRTQCQQDRVLFLFFQHD